MIKLGFFKFLVLLQISSIEIIALTHIVKKHY